MLGYEVLSTKVADKAFHDSGNDSDVSRCHPNTRMGALETIQGWILGNDNPTASIMWFYGPAESGKSVIARSIAEWCENRQILLASFFFSRMDSSRNNLKHFVPTLAYAMANSVPDCRSSIGLAVESDPHIFSRFVGRQFDRLITKPLSQLVQGETVKDLPYVIVIDGLDECIKQDEQEAVIQLFWSTLSNEQNPRWKVLVTSRFERAIQCSLDNIPRPNFSVRVAVDQYNPIDDIERRSNEKPTEMKRRPVSPASDRPPLNDDHLVRKSYNFGSLNFKLLKASSNYFQHPSVTLTVPAGTVVLGGGAYVDWDSPPGLSPPGNLLTAMYPNDNGTTWTVAAKDHIEVSKARVTAYCIVAQMKDGTPISADNYKVVSATSKVAAHPTLQVDIPSEYTVVGGGARVNYTGAGNMLYASYPTDGLDGWVGSAKDHIDSDPTTITVWAMGLRKSFLKNAGMRISSFDTTSSPAANHPCQTLVLPNFHLTGVGARVNWNVQGNLLTACCPRDHQTVVAEGKDHFLPDPSTITAYAIGFGEVVE